MALDPSIALGIRPLEVPNQLAQYAQMAQVENAQQQNALAQFQLGAARRAEQGQNALGQAYGAYYGGGGSMGGGAATSPAGGTLAGMGAARGGINYDNMRQAIVDKLRTTAPNLIPAELARINEMEQKGLLARKTQTEIDTAGLTQQKTRQELATTRTAQFRDQLSKVNSPEAAAQWTIGMYNDPYLKDTISSVPLETALAEIPKTPQEFNVWKNQNALGMAKFIELNKPSVTAQNTGGNARLLQTPGLGGAATVVPGSEAPITMSEYQRNQLKNEGQRIGLEGRRVAVLEENQRRDSDPAFQQRMSSAKALGEAIAKGDVAAQQALPKILTRAEEGMRLIDEMVGKQEVRDKTGKIIQAATKPHPGFENAVGTTWLPGARFVPGTDAADFMSRFDQVKGSSFLEAFESLKGGGSITEKEGAKATDAINRMSTSQSEKEFMAAARDLQEVIRKGVANAQTRASRSGGGAGGAVIDFGSLK